MTEKLGSDIHIGSIVYTEVTWDVKSLQQDVLFYINECYLNLGDEGDSNDAVF